MPSNPLRNLPSVSDLLDSPPLKSLVGRISSHVLAGRVRIVLDEVVSEMQTAATGVSLPSVTELAERIAHRLRDDDSHAPRAAINATGVLLDARLGPAPLADEAIGQAMRALQCYQMGSPADASLAARDAFQHEVSRLVAQLTGAEGALVVNSLPAARLLTLAALAVHRAVVVSRAHLGETHDGSRLLDAIAQAGARCREVGTANVTRPDEYRAALEADTALLWFADAHDHHIQGNIALPVLADVLRVAHEARLPVVHDLDRGCLSNEAPLAHLCFHSARQSIRSGAHLVLLSGDGLLGGPRCGIVLGSRELIARLEQHTLRSALAADNATLALLIGTLQLHLQPETARREIPLWRLIDTPVENLKLRALRIAEQIAASPAVATARAFESVTYLTGTPLPGQQLETWCVELAPRQISVEALRLALRRAEPPVVARASDERLVLDLRTVLPRQDQELVRAVSSLTVATQDRA